MGAVAMTATPPTGRASQSRHSARVWQKYCRISLSDFLSAEEADIAGPSDLIMTRGNPGEEEEEEEPEDSDTDDIDHSGEVYTVKKKVKKTATVRIAVTKR